MHRGPVDYSEYIVLLVLKAFSLIWHGDIGWYSAAIVRKMFADFSVHRGNAFGAIFSVQD